MANEGLCVTVERLRTAGLRPTRQRLALVDLIFGQGDRHVTAEMLHAEANQRGIPVSLATIYNTINQFSQVGLIREIAVEGSKSYYDTNTSDHFHFYFEKDGVLVDIDKMDLSIENMPAPPPGMKISRVDVLVRLVPVK